MCYWHKGRHIDKWTRIESLEKNPHVYDQMIFYKGAKTIWWGKGSQQVQLGKTGIHMQKKLGHVWKLIQNGSKILQSKIVKKIFMALDLASISRTWQATKEKIYKLDVIRIKILCIKKV